MEEKKQGSAESILRDFGMKIDELIEKAKKKSEEVDLDDTMDDLKKGWDKVDEKFKKFTEEHKDTFSEVGIRIENAGQELKKAFEAIFKEAPKKSEPMQEEE